MSRATLDTEILDRETLLQKFSSGSSALGSVSETAVALLSTTVRGIIAKASGGSSRVALNEALEARIGALLDEDVLKSLANGLGVHRSSWCDTIIERMARLGEVVQGAEQRWYSMPTRLVRLDRSNKVAAVISCEPTVLLQRRFGARIQQHGFLRYCWMSELTKEIREDGRFWQSADSWLRIERQSLRKWTGSKIASCSAALRAWGQPVEKLEIFVSTKARYVWKAHETLTKVSTRPFLCRSTMPGSKVRKEYWLGIFRGASDGPRLYMRSNLTIDEGLRLALGLRLTAFGARELTATPLEHGFAVPIPDRLPYPERRIQALAYIGDDRSFGFPAAMGAIVSAVLSSLGYKIVGLSGENEKDV